MLVRWNSAKNLEIQQRRDVSFEEVLDAEILDVIPHFNPEKYPNQKLLIIRLRGYVYYVPFVEEDDGYFFLKNIIPSRKFNAIYNS
ncbi:toxin [Candidatus Gracilibacteria bacterium]|nr:MAG: toxin [Candidatus Gracilibacteria bacterium]